MSSSTIKSKNKKHLSLVDKSGNGKNSKKINDVELPDIESFSKDPLTYVTAQFISATAEKAGQLVWDIIEDVTKVFFTDLS